MSTPQRPLILLDVDGVINDLGVLYGGTRSWETTVLRSNGFHVCIPDYMPDLIQHLSTVGEVMWCSTWRRNANDDIAPFLGIPPLLAIDDGTNTRTVDWKPAAAHPVAVAALAKGRRVIWIEDFNGDKPTSQMPSGVEFIDTAADGEFVLLPAHLPVEFRPDPSPVGSAGVGTSRRSI